MHRTLLPLTLLTALACEAMGQPHTTAASAEAAASPRAIAALRPVEAGRPTPTDVLQIDLGCFGEATSDMMPRRGSGTVGGYGRGGIAPTAAPPMATPSGAATAGVREKSVAIGGAMAESGAAQSADAAAAPVAAGPAPVASAPVETRAPTVRAEKPAEPPRDAVASEDVPWGPPAPPMSRARPAYDWGGLVHLSNDDASSLASAQRLLWALEHGASIQTSQIRPHELLNFYSFDAPSPAAGTMFGVAASATQSAADTLQLALSVQAASPARAPMDLTVLVDRSGSMSAEGRMNYTRRALQKMQSQLQRGDRFDLVLFDDRVCTPVRNFVVGRDDPARLDEVIRRLQPRGSTDLDLGLREAYQVATSHPQLAGRAGRVMVITDAILNTGEIDPATVSEIGRALDARDLRLTGVGVGSDFRDDVLDQLTEKGKGAYVFLGSERVVDRMFGAGFAGLVQTVAENVRFSLDLPESLGMKRFYGEESSRDPALVKEVNVEAGTHQVFFQDLAVQTGLLRPTDELAFTMTWRDPVDGASHQQVHRFTLGAALASDPHDVHKAAALMAWSDVLLEASMGAAPCGDALQRFQSAWGQLGDDAEVASAAGHLTRWCGATTPTKTPVVEVARGTTRVKIDSDVAVDAADLQCPGFSRSWTLTASDRMLEAAVPGGACEVTLHGNVPMTASVQLSPVGSEVRCVVRGGRMACT
jgi:Ca-activated chloride channel family protein